MMLKAQAHSQAPLQAALSAKEVTGSGTPQWRHLVAALLSEADKYERSESSRF